MIDHELLVRFSLSTSAEMMTPVFLNDCYMCMYKLHLRYSILWRLMETVLESDSEEQVRHGETREEEEEEEDDRKLTELDGTLSNFHVSAPQERL